MKKKSMGKWLLPGCLACLLSLELLLLADVMVVFFGGGMPLLPACTAWLVLTVGCGWLLKWNVQRLLTAAGAIPMVIGILTATGFACWRSFSNDGGYEFPDAGKNQIYGNRNVMLIVPHQDDELNILGGVLEEYARYGSTLYPVFVTNGDYAGLMETRYQEALSVCRHLGVPEEQVIFLGYGNEWKVDGPHIYNGESGVVLESFSGRTETRGTTLHPAYREGRSYTIDNLMEDMESVILEVRPDVIFCSDYDHHIDHKAVAMLFDKIMGGILKEHSDYRPVVYKAYAYGTAWEAEADYCGDNVLSTKNPFEAPYSQRPAVYRWEDRVRFPVRGASLSRSLVTSEGYKLLGLYHSQGAQKMAASVLNGDKVAWQRRTDSLCLRAEVSVSSGEGKLLHDFMLTENHDLMDAGHLPYDGVWIPADGDEDRTLTVVLETPSDLDSVVLYDHPDPAHNVLNAVITFEDGTSVETGALDPNGAATKITVAKQAVSSFRVMLKETEGTAAGLSEVEAFAQADQMDGRFIKLMDDQGNFLYDYLTAPDGSAVLSLYAYGDVPEISGEDWLIHADSEKATAVLEDGVIRIQCPKGESFVLNVTCNSAGVSDNIFIRNPGSWERLWKNLWQRVEEGLYSRYSQNLQEKLLIPSTLTKIAYVIRHVI